VGCSKPLASTLPLCHSSSKLRVNEAAASASWAIRITFSCSSQESLVQLVEPDQTDPPSRTAYLWCIRSGMPGMPRVSIGSASSSSGFVRGGGGTGTRLP